MDVYRTPAAALDGLVASSLQPPAGFAGTVRRALGALGAALRERGGRPGPGPGPGAAAPAWRVLKIAKVGPQVTGATSGDNPRGRWAH